MKFLSQAAADDRIIARQFKKVGNTIEEKTVIKSQSPSIKDVALGRANDPDSVSPSYEKRVAAATDDDGNPPGKLIPLTWDKVYGYMQPPVTKFIPTWYIIAKGYYLSWSPTTGLRVKPNTSNRKLTPIHLLMKQEFKIVQVNDTARSKQWIDTEVPKSEFDQLLVVKPDYDKILSMYVKSQRLDGLERDPDYGDYVLDYEKMTRLW